MTIRTATIDDAQAIAAVEARCFPRSEAATEEEFRERLSAFADHFWLLYDGDTLVCFINGMVTEEPDLCDVMYHNAGMHRPDGRWQMIFGVNTIPEYRRQGYAAQVMERVVSDAKRQGRAGLVLTCKEHMLHYYKKFGFINEGLSASSHGDAVWYQMRLSFGEKEYET